MHLWIRRECIFLALALGMLGGLLGGVGYLVQTHQTRRAQVIQEQHTLTQIHRRVQTLRQDAPHLFPSLHTYYGWAFDPQSLSSRWQTSIRALVRHEPLLKVTSCLYHPPSGPDAARITVTLEAPDTSSLPRFVWEKLLTSIPGAQVSKIHIRPHPAQPNLGQAQISLVYHTIDLPPLCQNVLARAAHVPALEPSLIESQELSYFLYHSDHQWSLKFGHTTLTAQTPHPHWHVRSITPHQVVLEHRGSGKTLSWAF